eukprot:CAMPEP_0172164876 /NCGR_PEP_ID=MMETSP1050-20130122/8092_1 /TAXON_ID=233186 /ORGANISM="Cryptomonas curvata, Strain CCAP979/52" /LENGTH=62 /DNA_ID=CAMNT_0012835269 /DNA_START=522 /DNA_END=710 /DNA_ORIENTATION=-
MYQSPRDVDGLSQQENYPWAMATGQYDETTTAVCHPPATTCQTKIAKIAKIPKIACDFIAVY